MKLQEIINTKTIIWIGFVALVYILRHFFLIIFLTFLISYLMRNLIVFIQTKLMRSTSGVVYKVLTIFCFLALITSLYFGTRFTVPRLVEQGQTLVKKIGNIEDSPQKNIDNILRATIGQWMFEKNFGSPETNNYIQAFQDYLKDYSLPKEFQSYNKIFTRIESNAEKEFLKTYRQSGSPSENRVKFKKLKDSDNTLYQELIFKEYTKYYAKNMTWLDPDRFRLLIPYRNDLNLFNQAFKETVLPSLNQEEKNSILRSNFEFEESLKLVYSWKQGASAEKIQEALEAKIMSLIGAFGNYIASFLPLLITLPVQISLSLLLSFFITFDIKNLSNGALRLKSSRVADIYEEIVPGLVSFASLIGRAFQAQGVIAIVNTILTYALMRFLNIENTLFLSAIVFLCSFIPVLGVVLSGAPICAMAMAQDGGSFMLALWVVVGILVVHFIETSLLNPKIVGTFLHLHPVLVLIILAIGEHFFGPWGLLLGLPVAVYIIRIVILNEGLPWEKKKA